MDEILKIEHLVKTFGTNEVLRDIDFSVSKGDVISIIGSSGSGKKCQLKKYRQLQQTAFPIPHHQQNRSGSTITWKKQSSTWPGCQLRQAARSPSASPHSGAR